MPVPSATTIDGNEAVARVALPVEHGINLAMGMQNRQAAVRSGQWLLYRHDPRRAERGENPLQLDSAAPRIKVQDYLRLENRFRMLEQGHPDQGNTLFRRAQEDADARLALYQYLAARPYPRTAGNPTAPKP